MNTKDMIHKYIQTHTQSLSTHDFAVLTTAVIADTLHISRSLASQYLNELFNNGLIIKITSRPVYFLDRVILEKKYHVEHLSKEYLSVKELMEVLREGEFGDIFETVIGHDGSMTQVVQQIKSAVLYPNGGLPLILQGKAGNGKKFLVRTIHQYCLDKGLIEEEQKLYTVKSSSKALSMESVLFGNADVLGILEQKDIAIIYFEQGNYFDKDFQLKIAALINDGYYMKQKKTVKVEKRFIFGVSIEPHEYFEYALLQSIPIISRIPNFDQRGTVEKEAFIFKFFKEEQNHLGHKIKISYKLLEVLLQLKFDQDINELKKCITRICAEAMVMLKDDVLNCHVYHLPEEISTYASIEHSQPVERLIDINNYEIDKANTKIVQLFQSNLDTFDEFQLNRLTYSEMLNRNYESMRNYYDLLIFEESYSLQKINSIQRLVDEIFELKKIQGKINLPSNCSFVLSRMLLSTSQERTSVERWMIQHNQAIRNLLDFLREKMPDVSMISKEISNMIYQATELELSDFNMIFLIFNIYFYNDNVKYKDTAAIIVSHGYSTASSIADAANQLLEEHIFDAFDMPLDSSSEEIIAKVNDYLLTHTHYKNLILLVDMGSLELIGEKIECDINVGVINNISTSIALEIGSLIRREKQIEEILAQAAKNAIVKYKILNKAKKEKVMVFVSDAGIGVADRMVNLFKQSLPVAIDLRFISYDYKELLTNNSDDSIFSKFDVILMVKPSSLPIDKIRSVSLEDIVSSKDISVVDEALSKYLDGEEIAQFNRNLLKNFSLQNVMRNLTILNAETLLDFVSESTLRLENCYHHRLQNKTIVGIYIHVCFLIERLVTKTAIGTYEGVEAFEKEHSEFIESVNKSFNPMLEHYNVAMPLSEIALLYDYIRNDRDYSERDGEAL